MSDRLDEYLEAAKFVAQEAGKLIRAAFYDEDKKITSKASVIDLVTETDQACEKLIIETLKEKFPTHKFIGEESTAAGAKNVLTDEPTWVIDPVDGTTNFVHSFPFVAVCVGLSIDKRCQVGVVYNPILNEMYAAVEGKGAFKNDKKINVKPCEDMSKSLIITEWGSNRDEKHLSLVNNNFMVMAKLPCHGIRSLGSAALNMCQIASGGADGYFEFGIHAWDYGAASVIVTEAGGTVVDSEGGTLDLMAQKVVAACSSKLAKTICENIKQIPVGRD